MTSETFERILDDLFVQIKRGSDAVVRSAAISFINDIVLEQKSLIQAQKAKLIAVKLI